MEEKIKNFSNLKELLTDQEKNNIEKIFEIENVKNKEADIISCINKCTSPVEIKKEYDKEKIKEKIQTIFRAFDLFDLSETKVLILGQDPYPEPDKAHGLAFSVKNKKKRAASLTKIFKAVDNCYGFQNKKRDYNLTQWAIDNNVILLNTSLTYQKSEIYKGKYKFKKDLSKREQKELAKDQEILQKQHIEAWDNFIKAILNKLFENNENLTVFLWGEKAKNLFEKCEYNQKIKGENIYITCHPKKRSTNGENDQFLQEASEDFREFDRKFSNENDKIWKNLWNYIKQ